MERKEEITGFSNVMATIGGEGKKIGASEENKVLRCMTQPLHCYVLNKQKSIRPSYVIIRSNDRIFKLFVSEEL